MSFHTPHAALLGWITLQGIWDRARLRILWDIFDRPLASALRLEMHAQLERYLRLRSTSEFRHEFWWLRTSALLGALDGIAMRDWFLGAGGANAEDACSRHPDVGTQARINLILRLEHRERRQLVQQCGRLSSLTAMMPYIRLLVWLRPRRLYRLGENVPMRLGYMPALQDLNASRRSIEIRCCFWGGVRGLLGYVGCQRLLRGADGRKICPMCGGFLSIPHLLRDCALLESARRASWIAVREAARGHWGGLPRVLPPRGDGLREAFVHVALGMPPLVPGQPWTASDWSRMSGQYPFRTPYMGWFPAFREAAHFLTIARDRILLTLPPPPPRRGPVPSAAQRRRRRRCSGRNPPLPP